MSDISHTSGYDLDITETGDLAVASGSDIGKQRITRRLCTNPGDYIFWTDYGAGLPQRIGNTDTLNDITSIILEQMKMESAISVSPTPSIKMHTLSDGTKKISIQYSDSTTDETTLMEI
ncbi:phage tail protein [Acetobacter sp.]|uniref:phage tail protein n=1 Tax=Acetobacter sp. TaxID=440 RepID=UPI0025BB3263|nr:phage tail protein [Acetobacter sp.]MCH4091413.1 phage tail protein [Acetobacter sp.]MCI1299391.1 phage tail protein [Acetobacter sp.]MCI1316605.1 phage tail protein [Acetobacter sp.]